MRSHVTKPFITAVILSGGEARRMGGKEKGLIEFAGTPMIAHIVATLASMCDQVSSTLINTNNPENYAQFKLEIIEDNVSVGMGPLAGIQAGLSSISNGYLLVVPCDTPLLTKEPLQRLINAVSEHDQRCVVVYDGERMQATLALFHVSQKTALDAYLKRGGRRLMTWYQEQNAIQVDCSDLKDDFTNINTADDLQRAEFLKAARR